MVVILGADDDTVCATVDEIARMQLLSAGFRPVIVTDVPAFAAVRPHGYPAELIVDEATWSRSHGGYWEDYARARLATLFTTYRPTASVTLGEEGLAPAARLLLGGLRSAGP